MKKNEKIVFLISKQKMQSKIKLLERNLFGSETKSF